MGGDTCKAKRIGQPKFKLATGNLSNWWKEDVSCTAGPFLICLSGSCQARCARQDNIQEMIYRTWANAIGAKDCLCITRRRSPRNRLGGLNGWIINWLVANGYLIFGSKRPNGPYSLFLFRLISWSTFIAWLRESYPIFSWLIFRPQAPDSDLCPPSTFLFTRLCRYRPGS